jgi:hypothetical protein
MAAKHTCDMNKDNQFALITGASSGIGRALAVECAKRNKNLALVSLCDSGLGRFIKYLKTNYPVTIHHLEIDLTTKDAPKDIYNWCRNKNIAVNMLINNAGKGHLGPFYDYDYEFYENIIRLNIESVVLLTRLFIPELKTKQKSYILNLGSLASFYYMPYKTVYAGSKAFIYSFSKALRQELKNTTINISVLCPGPVITNQDVIVRIRRGGFWGKASSMRSSKMAKIAIDKLMKGKPVIVPGFINKFFLVLNKLTPGILKQKVIHRKFNVKNKV